MAGLLDNVGGVTTGNPTTISQQAQDIAKAQGVAYQDLSNTQQDQANTDVDFKDYDASKVSSTLDQNVSFKPSQSYIDEAKSTVQGQLQSILGSDSPYIQSAQQKAREYTASRGLQNSSLGAYWGQRAAVEAALPIAQQDAATFTDFASRQQQADYNLETIQAEAIVSAGMVEQKAAIETKQQAINNAFTAQMAGMEAQNKAWLQDLQNTYNRGITELETTGQKMLLQMELDAKQSEAVAQHATDVLMNYQVTIENWMSDPDFLNLGKTAVNNAINQLNTLAKNSINFVGQSQGIDLEDFVDTYLTDLTVYG